jgi:hypothetical protein
MATEPNDEFIPALDNSSEAFPTREQLNDTRRPDPLDFDEPDMGEFELVVPVSKNTEAESGAPDSAVDESDADVIKELVVKAKALGMHDDEVSQIKDTGALRSVVAALQRQAAVETSEDTEQSRRKPDAGASPSSEYEALSTLDPDDALDPSAIKAIKALKAEIDRLKSGSVAQAAPSVRPDEADYMIAKLGGDFADVFGEGPSAALSPKSEQYKARATVVAEMQRIREAARTGKKRVPDTSEAFDQAVRSVFGSKVKQVEQSALAGKVRQRESQLIARPSNNGKRPVSGREKAIASVAELMRSRMSGS